ncbi:MAG: iron-containing alcohol dehydrogenase [Succinivibrio sp.]
MDSFRSEPHCAMLFGLGMEEQVGSEIKLAGGSRALIHYGAGNVTDQALLARVRHSCDEAGVDYEELGGVRKNTRIEAIEEGIRMCRAGQLDFVLAIGGGSVVGSAKAIAAGAMWEGSFRDGLERSREVGGALPTGVIVTVPGSGSELSNSANVTADPPQGGREIRLWQLKSDFLYPKFAICNPELVTCFPKHLALSFANIFSRVCANFFNGGCPGLNEEICTATLRVLVRSLHALKADPSDTGALSDLMAAGVDAYTRCGAEDCEEEAVEAFAQAFKQLYDCAHGKAAGVLFPAWAESVLYKDVPKMARLMSGAFSIPWNGSAATAEACARAGLATVRRIFSQMGLPTGFEQFGGSGEDIPRLLDIAGLKDGAALGTYEKLNRDRCEAMLSLVLMEKARNEFAGV